MKNVNFVVENVAALNNDYLLLFQAPSDARGGGITINAVKALATSAGTASLKLLKYSNAGTPALAGTLAAGGSTVYALDAPQALTVSSAFVDANEWVAISEANIGAFTGVISIEYVMGK